MTCIVALIDDSKIWMGGDSAGVGGYDLQVRKDEKVFRNGDFLMGFTTSFRMGQLLRYALKPPKCHPDTDVYEFMVTDFIDTVRQCLKDGGYAKKENEVEEGGTFLVGVAGRLFVVDEDYQVGEMRVPFAAVGCGRAYALGSMKATEGQPAKERIRQALEAAEEFSAGVRGPFTILSNPTDGT